MTKHNWGLLSPERISEWITFDKSIEDWKYQKRVSKSMADKQAEGVAYLWNLLSKEGVALLADEVGTGKTFQALGVMSLLWKMKPEAKILVIAPNRDICKHWEREYGSFLEKHYKKIDHLVRNAADGGAVNEPQSVWKLSALADSIEMGAASLYLTTIYSFSGLLSNEEKVDNNKEEKAKEKAKDLNTRIRNHLHGDGFDLVIIDEAHYFRNVDGGSQRAAAAEAFFGKRVSPVSQKYLLLTATPSHSGSDDIRKILSLFVDIDKKEKPIALLDKYALRRLRLMKGKDNKSFNKYQYRNEMGVSANFSDNPGAEIFFAIYQKKLVEDLSNSKGGKKLLYGYLEGFESVGDEQVIKSQPLESNEANEHSTDDFKKAPDTEILQDLSKKYYDKFKKYPDHPKYDSLIKDVVPNRFHIDSSIESFKHLIFVRRIPSVRELTKRVNQGYDDILIGLILDAWGLKESHSIVKAWENNAWSREAFIELVRTIKKDSVEIDDELSVEIESENTEEDSVASKVANLFVVKKGENGRTDCSNVRLRFTKPESLFSMFFEPASDFQQRKYSHYFFDDEKNKNNFAVAAKYIRLNNFSGSTQKTEISKTPDIEYKIPVETAWSLIYPYLKQSERSTLEEWKPEVKENFSNYLKAGFLFASPVMVEVYCWFTKFNRKSNSSSVQDKYSEFIKFVHPKLEGSLLLKYFKLGLDSFEPLCEKFIDHGLNEWKKDWNTLKGLQSPASSAYSETSNRQRLILGFNSPFYPNVLVSTSVFQEGVNLHLQCKNVHHYGIAWTPGDNEQRVGRVDRLFGKVNKKLAESDDVTLDIKYPYLTNTFDEDQVGSFVKRKRETEEKMDKCLSPKFDREIQQGTSNISWEKYLRTPEVLSKSEDPYAAKFDIAEEKGNPYIPLEVYQVGDIATYLYQQFKEIIDPQTDNLYKIDSDEQNILLMIDSIIFPNSKARHQPIIVERHFSSEFSALIRGTVYYITLKTPIASKENLSHEQIKNIYKVFKSFESRNQLINLVLNTEESNSNFYLQMKVDLPVFVEKGRLSMLSKLEVEMAYKQLKYLADTIEERLFLATQDLKMSDIFKDTSYQKVGSKYLEVNEDTKAKSVLGSSWRLKPSTYGSIAQLNHFFTAQEISGLFYNLTGSSRTEKLLKLNSKFAFIRFSEKKDGFLLTLNYPSEDFQIEEQRLLKKWFDYVCSMVESTSRI